jgi:HD-GYP domain-containing protein (c-di-GMP phosphodiesterase class II)
LKYIRDQVGTRFDPEVMDTFLEALGKGSDTGSCLKVV